MRHKIRLFASRWGPGLIFIAAAAVFLFVEETKLTIPRRELIQHLLLLLAAVMGVQFLEHTWLRENVTNLYRNSLVKALQDSNVIIESAAASGLKNIYSSRNEKTLKKDVIKDLENARSRVWVLGVGLSEKISLKNDLLPKLKPIINKVEVRILLLDALRSPAVFRTFLESSADQFEEILKTDRSDPKVPPLHDPYFEHRLYHDFLTAYKELKHLRDFQTAIRFYAHSPSCWLIIIDETAYFQPYTFGREETVDPDNRTIGPLMPTFKFEHEANMKPFQILEDHFNKLWLTSDAGLFQIGGRIADKDRLVRKIFRNRQAWFEHVHAALYLNKESPGQDRRSYPRQRCDSDPRDVLVTWNEKQNAQKLEAEIVNFSRESVLLKVKRGDSATIAKICDLNNALRESEKEKKVKVVDLDITSEFEIRVAKYFKEELIKPSKGKFKIVRITDDKSHIALKACADARFAADGHV